MYDTLQNMINNNDTNLNRPAVVFILRVRVRGMACVVHGIVDKLLLLFTEFSLWVFYLHAHSISIFRRRRTKLLFSTTKSVQIYALPVTLIYNFVQLNYNFGRLLMQSTRSAAMLVKFKKKKLKKKRIN